MTLNKLIIVSMIITLIGCKTSINGVHIWQENKCCFTKKELANMIHKDNRDSIYYSYLSIGKIVVHQKKCIGLYGFIKREKELSDIYVVDKVLKTEDSIYYYSEDEKINKHVLDDFFMKYGASFSEEEKKELIKYFNRGNEIRGVRYY